MDTSQWPQGVGVVNKPMESSKSMIEKRTGTRPQKDQVSYCPRCNSTNTKFCYYNNYSLTQPRYFCKTCRRYWTEGGSLRNVPVGGGSRKNKRSISSPSSSSSRNTASHNPKFIQGGQDLNLAYPPAIHEYNNSFSKFVEVPNNFADGKSVTLHENSNPTTISPAQFPSMELFKNGDNRSANPSGSNITKLVEVPYIFGNDKSILQHESPNLSTTSSPYFPPMELFKNGNHDISTNSRGLMNSLLAPVSDNSATIYSSSGFPMHEFKPIANFSQDEFNNGSGSYGNLHGVQQQNSGARVLFPFEDNLKQVSNTTSEQFEHSRGQGDSGSGYWKGMLSGGSW